MHHQEEKAEQGDVDTDLNYSEDQVGTEDECTTPIQDSDDSNAAV